METRLTPSRPRWASTSRPWSIAGEDPPPHPPPGSPLPSLALPPLPCLSLSRRFKLNIWDVGGQKSLRSYWRNYFESTDGLIWVVDSADHQRMEDCKKELETLLVEEVGCIAGEREGRPPLEWDLGDIHSQNSLVGREDSGNPVADSPNI